MKLFTIWTLWLLFAFGALCWSAQSHADDTKFFVNGGILAEHLLAVSGTSSGGAGTSGGTYGMLGVGLRTPFPFFGGNWYFMPSVSYSVVGRTLNDDAGNSHIWNLALPFAVPVSFFDFKLGVGMLFYNYRGSGGSVTLPNETGTPATYYRPSDSVTAKVVFTDMGFAIDFGPAVRFDLDFYINGILSLRRDFSLVSTVGYFF